MNQVVFHGYPRRIFGVDVAIYYQSYYETIDFIGSKILFDDGGNLEQHGYTYDFVSPADSAFLKEKPIAGDVTKLLKMPNVIRLAASEDLYQALQNRGLYSDASYSRTNLLANHRSGDGVEFYYLYNYGNAKNYRAVKNSPAIKTTVTLRGEGQPYRLDAWTGNFEPLAKYRKISGGVEVDVNLAGNDSAIFALIKNSPDYPSVDTNLDAAYNLEGKLTIKNFAGLSAINLTDWTLSIESWTKGLTPTSSRKNIIDVGRISTLQPWREMPWLENVSGIGTYRSEFVLSGDNLGAILTFGGASDTLELRVNGNIVPLDPIAGEVDISSYIRRGTNTVEFSVATSLLNAVLKENTDDQRGTVDYGLFGGVKVQPYRIN